MKISEWVNAPEGEGKMRNACKQNKYLGAYGPPLNKLEEVISAFGAAGLRKRRR
jgi:hypothetical protein